ncbi:MAG: hypothetical protein RL308_381 [Bacteroidota bacterium]|jgi:hypothetical protein
MFSFKLKTHKLNTNYSEPHFFILNKGNHSGKPLSEPCPNCFVCICSSEEEREMLYWLVMGLCQGRVFEKYLCGSVIPFVRINDVKKALNWLSFNHTAKLVQYKKKVIAIQKVQQAKNTILQQLQSLQSLQKVLVADLMK